MQYTGKKNEIRKQVYVCLGEGLNFIRDTLLERKEDMTFLGKEGRKSEKPPIRTTSDFPLSAYKLTKGYACGSNPYAFFDGHRGNSKQVDICMVLGTGKEIAPLLDEWTMDLAERGIGIKKYQLVHTYDKFMFLGVLTRVFIPVVERQCGTAFEEAEHGIKADKNRMHDQGHHTKKELLKFSIIKKYPAEMSWVPTKEDEDRPNNCRLTFIMLLKEDQDPACARFLGSSKIPMALLTTWEGMNG